MLGDFRGCGRGVFGLSSWEPLRKPGEPSPAASPREWNRSKSSPVNTNTFSNTSRLEERELQNSRFSHNETSVSSNRGNHGNLQKPNSEMSHQRQRSSPDTKLTSAGSDSSNDSGGPKPGNRLLAKYSYSGKPDSPLGVELTLKQGDKLKFVGFHDSHWWLAEDASGAQGFVPASYMMVMEDKVSGLPWLQNRKPDPESESETPAGKFGKPSPGSWKPYRPSYEHKELKAEMQKKYYCDVCEKSFNGPQPYNAHMNSRSHREEVEYQNSH